MNSLRRNLVKQLLEIVSPRTGPRAQSSALDVLTIKAPSNVSSSASYSSLLPAVRPVDPRHGEGSDAPNFEPRRRGFSTAVSQAAVLASDRVHQSTRESGKRGQLEGPDGGPDGRPPSGRPTSSAAAAEHSEESGDESAGEAGSGTDDHVGSTTAREPSGAGQRPPDESVPIHRRAGKWSSKIELTKSLQQAETFEEVIRLCEDNIHNLNIFHATAAIHRLGKLIGIKRSAAMPILLTERRQQYHAREALLQSNLFQQLQGVIIKQKRRASKEMLCLILWGLSRLRANPNVPPTPRVVVEAAGELERLLHLHAPFEGSQLLLSQACWGLSQLMRQDAPWGDLLRLIGQSLRSTQPVMDPGPASTVLKATAIYRVVYGVCPMPGDVLDFLAESLLQPEHHSPGPQAISQGLYSLAKLGHRPPEGLLQTLCLVLPTRVTGYTTDRQAVGNAMWAMAALDVKPSNMLYRQLTQLVLMHCNHFLPHHFSQVLTALKKWDQKPEAHIMHFICRGIMHTLPVAHPNVTQNQKTYQWRHLYHRLEEMGAYYDKAQLPMLENTLQMVRQVLQEPPTAPTPPEDEAAFESSKESSVSASPDAYDSDERAFLELGAEDEHPKHHQSRG